MLSLLLTSGLFWLDLGTKQALVCDKSYLTQCVNQISIPVHHQQLPSITEIIAFMGERNAMALAIDDYTTVGMVIVDPQNTLQFQQAMIEGKLYQISLKQQFESSLWHEVGHLTLTQVESELIKQQLVTTAFSPYQHEILADLFLLWKSAKQTKSFELAWQQYHRRNLAFISNTENVSHWSVPTLYQAFNLYNLEQILIFESFEDLLKDYLSKINGLDQQAQLAKGDNKQVLDEYSSLVQHLFGNSTVNHLAGYIYWRRAKLRQYLAPTLTEVMGHQKAKFWLDKYLSLIDIHGPIN